MDQGNEKKKWDTQATVVKLLKRTIMCNFKVMPKKRTDDNGLIMNHLLTNKIFCEK